MPHNEWDEYADEWESNTATGEYANNAFNELKKVVKIDGLRVFDFGCGTGLLSERLSPDANEIVALDGSIKMIEQLNQKKLPNVFPIADFLSQSLIGTNPLLNTKFDLITASSVCAFLPDYEAMLPVLRSLLLPGGIYVQWDWLCVDGAGSGFSETRVVQAFERTGFIDIALTQPFEIEGSNGDMPVLMAVAKNG